MWIKVKMYVQNSSCDLFCKMSLTWGHSTSKVIKPPLFTLLYIVSHFYTLYTRFYAFSKCDISTVIFILWKYLKHYFHNVKLPKDCVITLICIACSDKRAPKHVKKRNIFCSLHSWLNIPLPVLINPIL